MHTSLTFKWILFVGILTAHEALSDPLGSGFTYQGEIKNNGEPVNGTVAAEFQLYDAESGGSLLGVQTIPSVPVSGGLFTVMLNAASEFGSNAFNGEERWLGISINGQGLSPRQKVTATPYAQYAMGPWSKSGSNLYYSGGNVGINTPDPQAKLALLFDSGTDSNKAVEFEFTGAGASTFDMVRNSDSGVRRFQILGGNDFDANTSFSLGMATNHPLAFMTNAIERVRVSAEGNVGIGTPAPQVSLDVVGDRIRLTNADKELVLRADGGFVDIGSSTSLWLSTTTGDLLLLPEGKVGVGTSAPSQKLEVAGNIRTWNGLMWSGGTYDGAWSGSILSEDQHGAIELGDSMYLGSTPFIDFHYGTGSWDDFNVRLVNNADKRLVLQGDLRVQGAPDKDMPAVEAVAPGAGPAGSFVITNPANVHPAVYAETSGSGPAINMARGGLQFPDATIQWTAATAFELPYQGGAHKPDPIFSLINVGTGGVGLFTAQNTANTGAAVEGTTNGTGPAIKGTNSNATGGSAGVFTITGVENRSPAIVATSSTTWPAIKMNGGGMQFPDGTVQTSAATGGANGWSLSGNTGTNPATSFLGTLDYQPLEIRVSGWRALRVEPCTDVGTRDYVNWIAGAPENRVDAGIFGATISGGSRNTVGANLGTVGGGNDNGAWGVKSTVAGGENNAADGFCSTVAGGRLNQAGGEAGSVGGGFWNATFGNYAAICGGSLNRSQGEYSVIPGGFANTAGGNYSFAAGQKATVRTGDHGTFIWGDSTQAEIQSTGTNQFIVRASGGLWLGTNSSPAIPAGTFINTSTGASLSAGGTWTNNCSRDAKDGYQPVDGRQLLDKLAKVPVQSWRYKNEDASVRHIGPVAQDFHEAFKLGQSAATISTVDADGVALAGVQELYRLAKAKDAEIADLKRKNEGLETRLAAIEAGLAKLAGSAE